MSAIPVTPTRRLALPLAVVAAVVVAGIADAAVAAVAVAAGASPDFAPLQPGAYLFLTVVGIVVASVAWWLISRTSRAASTMRWLAPAVVLVSLAPDIQLGATRSLPNTSWTGVVGLMVMHLVVAGAALLTFSRARPLHDTHA